MDSLCCFRDEPVLLFELFIHVSRAKQVLMETALACNTSRLAENSHQSLHSVQVRLALLYSLRYSVNQIMHAAIGMGGINKNQSLTSLLSLLYAGRAIGHSGICILYAHSYIK